MSFFKNRPLLVVGVVVLGLLWYHRTHHGEVTSDGNYHNSKYGYSMHIEPGWTLESSDLTSIHKILVPNAESLSVFKAEPDPEHPGRSKTVTLVTVRHVANPSKLGLKELYLQDLSKGFRGPPPAAMIPKLEDSTFVGRPAVLATIEGTLKTQYLVGASDTSAFLVELNVLGDDKSPAFFESGKAMLDSFQFDR